MASTQSALARLAGDFTDMYCSGFYQGAPAMQAALSFFPYVSVCSALHRGAYTSPATDELRVQHHGGSCVQLSAQLSHY